MKFAAQLSETKRPYRQDARARAAEATGARILDAFAARLRDSWFEEIRLEDVAQDAGVTVQTVIRRFGGKEGLLSATSERLSGEVIARRVTRPGDVDAALAVLASDYEASGDLVMRLLSQEDRYPAVKAITDHGRAHHRGWVAEVFSPWLSKLPPLQAQVRLDALVVATDLYVWKLVRRDMRRPVAALTALMRRLVEAALPEIATSKGPSE